MQSQFTLHGRQYSHKSQSENNHDCAHSNLNLTLMQQELATKPAKQRPKRHKHHRDTSDEGQSPGQHSAAPWSAPRPTGRSRADLLAIAAADSSGVRADGARRIRRHAARGTVPDLRPARAGANEGLKTKA